MNQPEQEKPSHKMKLYILKYNFQLLVQLNNLNFILHNFKQHIFQAPKESKERIKNRNNLPLTVVIYNNKESKTNLKYVSNVRN